jgi:WD40 repeat protein
MWDGYSMARLFISHSSRNNAKAIEVRDWLAANGWDDVFLDLDPERGIVAGQRWKEALQQAAYRCEVVLALVSAEWLASGWCKSEIDAARLMGKKIIVALTGLDKSQVPLDLLDEQFIDLSGDPQAYPRLKEGLKHAGLDPLSFPFEAGRRPYPGFAYFEEQDAAVFFGRDAQIVRGLDEFRRLVRTGVTRMLVILGASGSGKSSFLRAGLWPRLKRDDRAWLPLPIIRPERAVISGTYGLVQALQQIIREERFKDGIRQRGLPRNRPDIEDFIKTEGGLVTLFDALRDIGQVPGLSGENASPPTIVLALDQGEELFNEEGRDEAERFVDILTSTLRADPRTLAIFAMRSDSFPLVQAHPSLAALPKDTFTLDMMLEGSYRAVIEEPARLIQPTPLRIDPQLTDALLVEISGQDALPLLAFTLAHLYENYAVDNELTLSGYDKLGRVRGVIDTAVKQAFADGVAKGELPKDAKAQLALARAAFIPHLAQVNAAGQFVRRVATLDQIPVEPRPLIDSFAEQRLLIKDRRKDADGKDVDVVEVAHEVLLRQPPFNEWLEEDREFLIGKQQLQNDLRDWEEAKPADKKGALVTGLKLSRMRAWLEARPQDLTPQERDFGRASIEQADAEERRKARQRRIVTRASIAAAVVLACFAVVAGWEWREAEIGQINAVSASAKAIFLSNKQLEGIKTAISAVRTLSQSWWQALWPDTVLRNTVNETIQDLLVGVTEHNLLSIGARVKGVAFAPDDKTLATWTLDNGKLQLWRADGAPFNPPWLQGAIVGVKAVAFGRDGKIAIAVGNKVVVGNLADGESWKELSVDENGISAIAFSADGKKIAAATTPDGKVGRARLWNLDDGSSRTLDGHDIGVPMAVAFSPDGDQIAVAAWNGAFLLRTDGTEEPKKLEGDEVNAVSFSPDGSIIATGGNDKMVRLWKADGTPATKAPLCGHADSVWGLSFRPDGEVVASASNDGMVKLWQIDGTLLSTLAGDGDAVRAVAFSHDGKTLASAGDDGTVKLWFGGPSLPVKSLTRGQTVYAAAFSPNGRIILTTSGHGWLTTWDPAGTFLQTYNFQYGPITAVAFSRDGKMVATAAADRTVWLSTIEGRKLSGKGTLEGQTGETDQKSVLALSFSPNGKSIAGGVSQEVQIWSTDQPGSKPKLLPTTGGWIIVGVDFSPDGKNIVVSDESGKVVVVDSESGAPVLTLSAGGSGSSPAYGVRYSPNGETIAAYTDHTVKRWTARGKPLRPLSDRDSTFVGFAFSQDGKWIASESKDGTVKIWTADGKLVKTLPGHEGTDDDIVVDRVAFSPDGRMIASANEGRSVILWNWQKDQSLDGTVADACQWIRDYLTNNSEVNKDDDRHLCDGVHLHELPPAAPAVSSAQPEAASGPSAEQAMAHGPT